MAKHESISWKEQYKILESKYQQLRKPAIKIQEENQLLRKENDNLKKQLAHSYDPDYKDLVSLVLWAQRRLPKAHKEYVQAELAKNSQYLLNNCKKQKR